jgi:hypothetical protein
VIAVPALGSVGSNESKAGAIRAVDKAAVDAAMKRAEEGATDEELDTLPLPELPYVATGYALTFKSAWKNRSGSFHVNADDISDVRTFAWVGGWRYYSEWACRTGQERAVAEKVVNLLPRVVNTYVLRLLVGQFIEERRYEGYDRIRKCDRQKLKAERARFDQLYVAVSKLAGAANDATVDAER